MSPDMPTTFRIPDELMEAMRIVRKRDGVPISEQVRRAIVLWLETKGVVPAEKHETPRHEVKKRSARTKPRT